MHKIQDTCPVTVVIPCYNSHVWIANTIKTVVAQTYRPLEVVVVDDGSTDRSAEIAEHTLRSDKTLSYRVIRIPNGGPSRARNIGWKAAKGEWIQFLDADDWLLPDKISIQMQMIQTPEDDHAVIYSKWQSFVDVPDGGWQVSGQIRQPQLDDPVVDLLKTGNFLATGSHLIRRSWLERVSGFYEDMRLIEDVNLLLRIAAAGGAFSYAESTLPLFLYRQRSDSLSRSDSRAFIQGCLKNAKLVEEWIRERNGMSESRNQTLQEVYSFVARSSFERDRESFNAALNSLEGLSRNGRYIPEKPIRLRWASIILGYSRAELLALFYRRVMGFLRRQAGR